VSASPSERGEHRSADAVPATGVDVTKMTKSTVVDFTAQLLPESRKEKLELTSDGN